MRSAIKRIFVENALRKFISLVLAVIIWLIVNQSLTSTRTFKNVAVRIVNVPEGKTINGLQTGGYLPNKLNIAMTGRKSLLDDLNQNDFEIALDAFQIKSEKIVTLQKKNIVNLNPDLDLDRHITKINNQSVSIRLVPLSSEKIPLYITPPIGSPPKGYEYLDIWPYHLHVNASGPEDEIKKLKAKGLKLTFNLNHLDSSDLDHKGFERKKNVLSFYIPDDWKKVNIPTISNDPIQINDPASKLLRIDFVRNEQLPVRFPIPLQVFVPPDNTSNIVPTDLIIPNNEIVQTIKGIKTLNLPLYANGVSNLFIDIIEDHLSLSLNVPPYLNDEKINWSLQIINPKQLEDKYVSMMQAEFYEETSDMDATVQQSYLRNRFRSFMNRFQLVTEDGKPLDLNINLEGKKIFIHKSS